MTWAQAFAPLRERNFAWYYASNFVNLAGSMMATVALTFAVLDQIAPHSVTALGEVLAARTVPMLLLLLFGGVIADRLPRTLLLQASNLLSALTQGTVAWLVITGRADLWMVIVLQAANGAVSSVSFPALTSLMPQLVKREQLQQANALMSLSRGGLTIMGPSVSALLVVTVGPGWALAVDAATWLASAGLLLGVRIPPRPRAADAAPPNMLRELREGWSAFTSITWLWLGVAVFAVLNFIQAGAWYMLGPTVAEQTVGRQAWGLILSAQSFGLVVITLVLLRVTLKRPMYVGLMAASIAAVPMIVLGVAPHLVLLLVTAFLSGVGMETFGIGWDTSIQEHVDEQMLSRAYSYDALGSYVAVPIGQLVYGPLGLVFGYRDVLAVSGIAYGAICLLTLTSRSIRGLRRTPSSAVEPVTG
ncbi:MAG: MFS transporter [Nocardioidaceae bacterium]